ncbi:MAG: hypothetical protein JWP69_2375 [Flaviaesturariibacter sp.]|nr:hypothetical protein [Flaviaesturariibacter sp.]
MKYILIALLALTSFSCQQSKKELSNKSDDFFDTPALEVSKASKAMLLQYLNDKATELEISIKKYPDSTELKTTLAFIREREKALQVEK